MQPSVLHVLAGLAAVAEAAPWSVPWFGSRLSPHPTQSREWFRPSFVLPSFPGFSGFPVSSMHSTILSTTSTSKGSSILSTTSKSLAATGPSSTSKATTTASSTIAVSSIIITSSIRSSSTVPDNACATVSSLIATQSAAVPTVPAQVAWACMQSVPLNATSALMLVEEIKPYLTWQTTTSYLKNPPAGYLEPAINIWGEIAAIEIKLMNGSYVNEYWFEWDLYRVFQRAHDGHFRFLPSLIAGLFHFARPVPLVSVSLDGKSLPKPYVYADILLQSYQLTAFTPSPITLIDGQDAVAYLENLSTYGSLQDPDALYNNVFYELAQISLGNTGTGAGSFAGGGRGAYFYAGQNTTLTFANGSSTTFDNFARVYANFKNVTTGQQVYNIYLDPPVTVTTSSASSSSATTSSLGVTSSISSASTTTSTTVASTPAPGYPDPVIRQVNNQIGGYYIDSLAYQDVAILSIPSFVGYFAQEASFQAVANQFLASAYAAGKKKLIIDVSANAGGTILQGYSIFKSLFPSMDPYGGTRFRAHETFDLIGREVSAYAGAVYPWDIYAANNSVLDDFAESPFDYRADMTEQGTQFTSWAQKYGPHTFNGDNFTSIIRWNLSDPFSLPGSGIIVDGYQNMTGYPAVQYFAAQDIVIVYDGYCASTCTIFSELMRQQGGVKAVAMGGRPKPGPMQAVGGVKGTNDYPWSYIYQMIQDVFSFGNESQVAYWETTTLATYSDYPFRRGVSDSGVVNSRDGIRKGDASETPLQFVYEPADCRIYYTPEMTVSVTAIWKAVYDSTWGKVSHCVDGNVTVVARKHEVGWSAVKRSEDELAALIESMNVYTDISDLTVVGDGLMLP